MQKLGWIVLGVAFSVATLVLARQFLVWLPADHFCASHRQQVPRAQRLAKQIAGLLLIALGAVLALPGVPGQGLLLVLIGLILLDLPPLRRLELRLLRMPMVNRAVNGTRQRAGRPPLQLPQEPPG